MTSTPEQHRRYTYGLSPEDHDALLRHQGGRCPICDRSDLPLVVDHDHRSGRVRGLLCGPCNRAIGHLRDSAVVCRLAAEYLRGSERAPARSDR
jgi:hypothetical protein